MNNNKLSLIIDGMYLTYVSYYGNRNMATYGGVPTGALYGFINSTESLLKEFNPSNVIVAFDTKAKNFRHHLLPQYKSKREKPPEDLLLQLKPIKQYLNLRGIALEEEEGLEADDIIAYYCLNRDENEDFIIYSGDKDLMQLIGEGINLFHPQKKKLLDEEGIKGFFGVYPNQVVDYLSLRGDSSDNIPGVGGIGEKSAKFLIEKYNSIDNILNKIEYIEGKFSKKIKKGKEDLLLSHKLIDLSKNKELKKDKKKSRLSINVDLRKILEQYSFKSIIKRLFNDDVIAQETKRVERDFEIVTVREKEQFPDILKECKDRGSFAFDVETTDLSYVDSRLCGLSIGFEDKGYYFPFAYPLWEKVDYDFNQFKDIFSEIFADKKIKKIGHNLKFDISHLKIKGIDVKGQGDDTMLISYILYPNRRSHGLKAITEEFLNYKQKEYSELVGKGKNKRSLEEISIEELGTYCVEDSVLSFRLVKELLPKLNKSQLKLYRELELPLIDILSEIELHGVTVDKKFLEEMSLKITKLIEGIQKDIFTVSGYNFNLNSSKQLGEFLFEKLNLPVIKKTRKTGSYSTDNSVLQELKDYPTVEKIMDYRVYNKLLSTYVEGLISGISSDGKVHTSFNQSVTATGRLSSSDPNLQNIPAGEMRGINIRKAFIADKDFLILAADYSQIELRVMAHLSNDLNMINAFKQGLDIHAHTSQTVFGNRTDLSEGEKRKRAKIINFSVLYGSGPFSLSKELGVSYSEAQSFIEDYFAGYPDVRKFIDEVIEDCKEKLYVSTLMGRQRKIEEIISANKNIRENGQRMAVNTIIQGSAADIIKLAMIQLHEELKIFKSKMIMQVHDELVLHVYREEKQDIENIVTNVMQNCVELKVPLPIKLKKGINWGELS